MSLFELLYPLYHRKLDAQEKVLRSFVHQMKVLPLDSDAAEESAKIMGSLLRIGKPVNALDVLIAGTIMASGAEKVLSKDSDYKKKCRHREPLSIDMSCMTCAAIQPDMAREICTYCPVKTFSRLSTSSSTGVASFPKSAGLWAA